VSSNAIARSPLLRIPVFYTEAMVATIESVSPSAGKPKAVVESWRALGVPLEVISPSPVGREDIVRAHDPSFVDGVLAGTIRNGFGGNEPAVAASLPFTSGSMLDAAHEALRNGQVAAAPCSGFHHAHYNEAAGFCTFNGLMVAALSLRASGRAARVGILDFDEHYGDGTDDILARLGIDWVVHYTAGRHFHNASQAGEFLARIPGIVATMRHCNVILYQAGADPHIDDPLGGWLTTEQLAERDYRVFATAATLGIPVAWNLAGGYQTPLRAVLDIHDNILLACFAVYIRERLAAETPDPVTPEPLPVRQPAHPRTPDESPQADITAAPRLLVSIGAEGGAIALYGDMADPAHRRFKVVVIDQTPMLLSEDDGGPEIRRDSGWLPTWSEAMLALGKYPWPHLHVLFVDPEVTDGVWEALQEYVGRSTQTIRDSAMSRWRRACGQSQASPK
jgi:acetoin utilization deacetylase AcuC-like enzyme